ncbi:MAG: gas vesicle protein [Deltaproteobacteria bacterium]|nr:gas vesicle protein [Deltaproteobacteria bacterium]
MPRRTTIQPPTLSSQENEVTLCEVLDRVLAKGVVAQGSIVIAVANIPLIQVRLAALLASVESLQEHNQ